MNEATSGARKTVFFFYEPALNAIEYLLSLKYNSQSVVLSRSSENYELDYKISILNKIFFEFQIDLLHPEKFSLVRVKIYTYYIFLSWQYPLFEMQPSRASFFLAVIRENLERTRFKISTVELHRLHQTEVVI